VDDKIVFGLRVFSGYADNSVHCDFVSQMKREAFIVFGSVLSSSLLLIAHAW